jgi:putative exporter of polyketide antibiotics
LAEITPQNYANHARTHPPFHFVLLPGALVLLILTIINVVQHYARLDAWILLLLGLLFPLASFLIRSNALRVQDRLIRLEERLRMEALLSADLSARIGELTESQLIALRFASDNELPALVAKVLAAKMQSKDIKQAIVTWRADTFRV